MKQLSYLLFIFILLLSGCKKDDQDNELKFTRHSGNPVMLPGSATDWDKEFVGFGSVIYHNNKYHMWYSGGSLSDTLRIGYATSPDGTNWAKYSSNPVLKPGKSGTWDSWSVATMSVIDEDGKYKM